MVLRLIIDAVRRKWLIGAFAVFQLNVMFQFVGRVWPSVGDVAVTMSGAFFLSNLVGELFSSRVLYQLPVSRRTWWLARWWMSVVVTVVIAQLANSITLWRAGSPWFDLEPTLLSMTFGILYCGFGMAGRTTSIGKSSDAPHGSGTFMSSVAVLPTMLFFIAAPFLVAPYLPDAFADLQTTSIIVMLVMAAFTAVGYRHTPAIEPRPDMRIARRLPPVPSSGAPAMAAPTGGFIDRLTGAKMVLWEECRKQFILFATVIAMGVAYWAIGSQFRTWPGLGECLRKASLLPFTSSQAFITEPIVIGALVVVANFADGWMAAGMRSLRTLPISSTRLSTIPLGLGLVSASMLWIVLLALHALVLRTLPASLRPDLFIAFAALTAVAQTIRFAAPGQMVSKTMLSLAPVAIIWLALGYTDSWRADLVQSGMLIGGLLTLAASWAAMYQAVMRSKTMYQPRPAIPVA